MIPNKPAKTCEAGLNESVILIEFDAVDKDLAARRILENFRRGHADKRIVLMSGEALQSLEPAIQYSAKRHGCWLKCTRRLSANENLQ